MTSLPDCGLYALTDGPREDLIARVGELIAGGACLVQYRDETDDAARRLAEATALVELCTSHGIPLLVSEDIALAQASGASGVHLSEVSQIVAARQALGPDAIIGVACCDSIERGRKAVDAGATYISFGAFFPSPTKPHAPRANIDLLRQSAGFGVPRVAIGGITPDNGARLVEAGADFLASVSALFQCPDPRQTAQRFADLYR